MSYTGEIIKVAPTKQDPSLPLPSISYKEKDFKSRRQYLNARARAAGYENYNEWLEARRKMKVPKGTGGRRPDLYAIILEDFRMKKRGVDLKSIREIEEKSGEISEKEAIKGLRDEYKNFLRLQEEMKVSGYEFLSCEKYYNMREEDVIDFFKASNERMLVGIARKRNLLQSAYRAILKFYPRNVDEFIKIIEYYYGKEIV